MMPMHSMNMISSVQDRQCMADTERREYGRTN